MMSVDVGMMWRKEVRGKQRACVVVVVVVVVFIFPGNWRRSN